MISGWEIAGLLGIGLASSGHCVGMCGGFALAVGQGTKGPLELAGRHAAYHAGKALTYAFLAVLLAAGFGYATRAGWFAQGQMVLSVLAGSVMTLFGIFQLFEIRLTGWWQRLAEPIPGCRSLAAVARSPGPLPAFATGWLNGFLPCGVLLGVLLHLAATESAIGAGIGAFVFGAATFPGLFLFGLAAHAWQPDRRRLLVRITGGFLILFGVLTILRASPEFRHWLHGSLIPAAWNTVREWCGF